jgi:hypothetical protein
MRCEDLRHSPYHRARSAVARSGARRGGLPKAP